MNYTHYITTEICNQYAPLVSSTIDDILGIGYNTYSKINNI